MDSIDYFDWYDEREESEILKDQVIITKEKCKKWVLGGMDNII